MLSRLNKRICDDLNWWLKTLNKLATGIPFKFILCPRNICNYTMWTDAYVDGLTAGIGGYNCSGQYFQFRFNLKQHFCGCNLYPDINWFELAGVTIALLLWGNLYRHNSVRIWCDNAPSVGQLSKR